MPNKKRNPKHRKKYENQEGKKRKKEKLYLSKINVEKEGLFSVGDLNTVFLNVVG